jgi:large subunit ribosomal protein L23
MDDPYSVIKRPLITEKGMGQASEAKYVFQVDPDANKIQIAEAIHQIFSVDVVKVNTLRVKGLVKRGQVRTGRGARRTSGKEHSWKKAYVTLKPGQRIEVFEGA